MNSHLPSSWISSPQLRNTPYKTQMSGTQRLSYFFRYCRTICRRKSPHSSLTGTDRTHMVSCSGLGFCKFSLVELASYISGELSPMYLPVPGSGFLAILLPVSCCTLCCCVAKHQNYTLWISKSAELFRFLLTYLSV